MSRDAFLNSRSEEKKHFLWRSYRVKTNQKVIYRGLLLFSQTMLSYYFGILSEFAKVFERKISAVVIIAGGQIFKITVSRFVNLSKEKINLMKENAIPRNAKKRHKVRNDTLQR